MRWSSFRWLPYFVERLERSSECWCCCGWGFSNGLWCSRLPQPGKGLVTCKCHFVYQGGNKEHALAANNIANGIPGVADKNQEIHANAMRAGVTGCSPPLFP